MLANIIEISYPKDLKSFRNELIDFFPTIKKSKIFLLFKLKFLMKNKGISCENIIYLNNK